MLSRCGGQLTGWVCHHAPFIVAHFKAHPRPRWMMGNLKEGRLDIVSAGAKITTSLAFVGRDDFVSVIWA